MNPKKILDMESRTTRGRKPTVSYVDPDSEEEIPTKKDSDSEEEQEEETAEEDFEFVRQPEEGLKIKIQTDDGKWVGATVTRPSASDPTKWWLKYDVGAKRVSVQFERKTWRIAQKF